MDLLAQHLERAIKAAGIPIIGVTIGDPNASGTWTVRPSSLQATAQPIIDAFNPASPTHEDADHDAAIQQEFDTGRALSAIVWAVIDTYSAPATKAKYNAARAKIVTAYKTRPWL